MFLEEMTKHGIMKDIEGIEQQAFDTSPNREEPTSGKLKEQSDPMAQASQQQYSRYFTKPGHMKRQISPQPILN